MLLAGDIGGTKTHLALISPEAGPRAPLAEMTLPSRHFDTLEAMVSEFLSQTNVRVERASFGIAGPVIAGRVTATNLPWAIDEAQLRRKLNIPFVHLLNDLEAIACAVPWLGETPDDLYTLNAGQPVPGGAIGVIAPGTGLGEAYLTFDCGHYTARASEGGHTDFAPATRDEIALLHYLFDHLDHVSYERICSGIGIPNIYDFLHDSGYTLEPPWLAEELAAANDHTPIIVNTALDPEKQCKLCTATLDMFVSILGSEAGNLALKILATGGIYLGGGIPPRILPALKGERFLAAFRNKGRMTSWLVDVPIHVILNPKVALLGAAYHGLES
ncbi:MAG: glucokinase [Chloroflexi bacterium]|nr:glucokinase [Chloroflexota bacterium]